MSAGLMCFPMTVQGLATTVDKPLEWDSRGKFQQESSVRL